MASSLTFATTLRSHQRAAVDKLSGLRVGALYMDTGTGKTRTALELGASRIATGKADCILWLCPVSVQAEIGREIRKHMPGTAFEFVSPRRIRDWTVPIYIAGIESLSSSLSLNVRLLELVNQRRVFLVCDESTLIKNHRAARTLAIWRLGERCRYRLLLNGTPLSNNEKDLFSQWYFLDPRILGYTSFHSFAANHLEYDPERPGRIVRAHDVGHLVTKMAPYLYQVRKDECLELPPKSYSIRWCSMTRNQRNIYERTRDEFLVDADWESFSSTTIYRLFTALQQVACGLWPGGEPIFSDWSDNPRFQLLEETIEQLPKDSKTIIWCRYRHEFESIVALLKENYGDSAVAQFWGKVALKKRVAETERFANEARFLVANKACAAYGLNLQFCHYAIYYSNDFSWATRKQSEDRLHRDGQTNNVHIIDLVCENSIDARIHLALSRKENLVKTFRDEIERHKHLRSMDWIDVRKEHAA